MAEHRGSNPPRPPTDRRADRRTDRRPERRPERPPAAPATAATSPSPAPPAATDPKPRPATLGPDVRNPERLRPLAEIFDRLESVLASSPADETELVWIESRRGAAESLAGAVKRSDVRHDVEILVRVQERGRVGTHRTGWIDAAELGNAVRHALAQARVHESLPGLPHLPADATAIPEVFLYDEAIAFFEPASLSAIAGLATHQTVRARWVEGCAAIVNSRGGRRGARATALEIEIDGSTGYAARAARRASDLDLLRLTADAASFANSAALELPEKETPLLLSREATARLVEELLRAAFSAHAYRDGSSLLREHLGVQVFDPRLAIWDDGFDPRGLPFPFDLEGTVKHRVDLIRGGAPRTPALDQRHAALLGLTPTPLASGGDDALAETVFVQTGDESLVELMRRVDDGVFIGRLDDVHLYDLKRLTLSARGRHVRRIRGGVDAGPLPDVSWTASLLRTFSQLLGVGSDSTVLAPSRHGGLFGGTLAPALALRHGGDLKPVW